MNSPLRVVRLGDHHASTRTFGGVPPADLPNFGRGWLADLWAGWEISPTDACDHPRIASFPGHIDIMLTDALGPMSLGCSRRSIYSEPLRLERIQDHGFSSADWKMLSKALRPFLVLNRHVEVFGNRRRISWTVTARCRQEQYNRPQSFHGETITEKLKVRNGSKSEPGTQPLLRTRQTSAVRPGADGNDRPSADLERSGRERCQIVGYGGNGGLGSTKSRRIPPTAHVIDFDLFQVSHRVGRWFASPQPPDHTK